MKTQNNCLTHSFFEKNLSYIYFVKSLDGKIKESAILCKIKPNKKEKEKEKGKKKKKKKKFTH